MLAEWGRATLERLGYTVNVATDGAEALKLFSSDPHLYDLVITDYAMPRIPGSQLASELIEQRSDIPIILCTGYSETLSSEQAGQLGIRKFLTKPLARYELAVAVREVLDNKEPR